MSQLARECMALAFMPRQREYFKLCECPIHNRILVHREHLPRFSKFTSNSGLGIPPLCFRQSIRMTMQEHRAGQ